ncbi:putative transposase [Lewinella aquimaris]|uniref:Putative transposase n=1 Tax=Neolewinella aquimaris TaxID=1835722 RepID=A0A840E3P5_9BACT|nr:transposase [Neolewinella aquimaris]MBB4078362.1 putative transposase [Neolewinella aquimaris]
MYESNTIYHVYNQSINYEILFRSDGNYRYFMEKVRKHICPYADILAFCLMPDHFHFLLKPKVIGCEESTSGRYLNNSEVPSGIVFQQNLSNGIKTALSSYTQAYNRMYSRRGSLFKAKTKAKPGYHNFFPDAAALEGVEPFTRFIPYLKVCFFYIHDNPVKAKHVNFAEEWEFSSALDYAGYRDSGICNFAATEQLLGITRQKLGGLTDSAGLAPTG